MTAGAFAAFSSLRNRAFARLYAAQAISLLGDALTWVGLALLAYELAGEGAARILATALTLRVLAFVVLSPFTGVLADRVPRKLLLVGADAARVGIVAAIPFASDVAHVYVLMVLLNAFTAVFTPTFQASVPVVTTQAELPHAIALSGATYEVLGVLGPGIAGAVAALLGWQSVFWFDAATFAASGLLIATLAARLDATPAGPAPDAVPGLVPDAAAPSDAPAGASGEAYAGALRRAWNDVREGTVRLWVDAPVRFALVMALVAAIAGAWQLTHTVVLVKAGLGGDDAAYGAVMAAFGVGATVAALAVAALEGRVRRTTLVAVGAFVTSAVILPAHALTLVPLAGAWFVAGAGQNWVNLPTLALIAERTPRRAQGRVYGAHFAWSHLWWLGAYPLAGWVGARAPDTAFVWGGAIALAVLAVGAVTLWPRWRADPRHPSAAR